MLVSTLLVLLAVPFVGATHHSCSWKPFTRPPPFNGYMLRCEAQRLDTAGTEQAQYHCHNAGGVMIADFGKLKPGILEWGASGRLTLIASFELTTFS